MTDDLRRLDWLAINTIRMLAVDEVEKAKSGHPGMPLGAAPMAYILWSRFLRFNPSCPSWPDRDRFVLSAGHGSALLYALLHLFGYDLPMDELMHFRQWGSRTPGHPERGPTPGVEATTGPLGQGFANGVGMAMAERFLATTFNRPNFSICDHYTYAIVSDGDLMEGVASEAASLAGHLKLGKIVYLYDDNHISIEGATELAFTEDVCRRFGAYGWHTQRVADGNDLDAIEAAILAARANTAQPSLIAVRTHIGFGSPKQDDAVVHGEALGDKAVAATKDFYKWPKEKTFYVPDEARAVFDQSIDRGRKWEGEWRKLCDQYRVSHPVEAERFDRCLASKFAEGWDECIEPFAADAAMATREASGKVMNRIALEVPNLVGGSADLAPSTKTWLTGFGDIASASDAPRNVHFGVREHAMGAIVNGMALHGGVIPFGATFLVFSDYMRPAIRLAAISNAHSIFVFTHDSVGLGEDGPTHEPIEHLMSLRAMPNLTLIRPADANETAEAWKIAIERAGPVALALARQKVKTLDVHRYPVIEGVRHGGYILADCAGEPELVIIATGSEVQPALGAQAKLVGEGVRARVVSMPSWEIFGEQTQKYRDEVIPPRVRKRISIEAGATLGWRKWVGDEGAMIGIDRFGASAPGDVVMEKLGFTVDAVVAKAKELLANIQK